MSATPPLTGRGRAAIDVDAVAEHWPKPLRRVEPMLDARIQAHAGELLGLAGDACRRDNPAERFEPGFAVFVALQAVIARAGLTREDVAVAVSLLVGDAALAIAATDAVGDELMVSAEVAREALKDVVKAASHGLERTLERQAEPAAAVH